MPSSALGQVVEAGPQCGETSAELPYVFRILRPAHVPIISARLTGVNRRSIYFQYSCHLKEQSFYFLRSPDRDAKGIL